MNYTSFLVLIGRALRHVLRHAWQYGALIVAAIACESALCFAWRSDVAVFIAGALLIPIVTACTYALVGRDENLLSDARQRILRRAPLVIVLDFIGTAAWSAAFAAFGARDAWSGIALVALCVSLVYADVFAVLGENADGLLFARSIERSVIAAWNGLHRIGRSFSLIALQMLVFFATDRLQLRFEALHVQHASFWAQLPLGTIIVPPLSALSAFVFLDAIGHKADRSCGT